MSIISINLGGDDVASESAAKPAKYTFAKVDGKATLILPSSARAGLTEIKTHLKKAKSDRTKALRLVASHAAVLKQADAASTAERKKTLKAKAKTIKGQVSVLNKSAKAALSAANKSARTHGLGGLTLPISTDILASAKKLASAKTDEFGATGKRGKFKPRFTPDAKFATLTGKSLHPMTGPKTAAKKAAKKPVKKGRVLSMDEVNAATERQFGIKAEPTKQRPGEKKASGTRKPKKVAAKKSNAATAAAIVDKPFKNVFKTATTTEFGTKWARENWNFRRVGNKILMDNPGQLMAATITDQMAHKNGTTVDKIEQQLRDLRIPESKTLGKRVKRRPHPVTHSN